MSNYEIDISSEYILSMGQKSSDSPGEEELVKFLVRLFRPLPANTQVDIVKGGTNVLSQIFSMFALEQIQGHQDCEEDCKTLEFLAGFMKGGFEKLQESFEQSIQMNMIIHGYKWDEYEFKFPLNEIQVAECEMIRERITKAKELAHEKIQGNLSILTDGDDIKKLIQETLTAAFKRSNHN